MGSNSAHHAASKPEPKSSLGANIDYRPADDDLHVAQITSWAARRKRPRTSCPAPSQSRSVSEQHFREPVGARFGSGRLDVLDEVVRRSIAFVFSDTLIGTAQTDGIASVKGMAHSSELVGDCPNLAPDYAGSFSAPQSLIPDTDDTTGIWETAATYTEGNDQLIFVNEYTGPNGILTLSYTGQSGIAVMSVDGSSLPTPKSDTLLPKDPDTAWGSAIVTSGGYMYVYGADLDRTNHSVYGMKLARMPVGQSTDVGAWTYWNG